MWTPILVAAVFAYLIAHCFISVYEVIYNGLHAVTCLNLLTDRDSRCVSTQSSFVFVKTARSTTGKNDLII